VCLEFLAETGKLVRDEISLMFDGSAFQARGPAMENALSVYMKPGTVTTDFHLVTYLIC